MDPMQPPATSHRPPVAPSQDLGAAPVGPFDILQSAPEALQAVFENSADVVMLLGADRRISYVNRVPPPHSAADVVGQDAWALVAPESRAGMEAALARVYREGRPHRHEAHGAGPGGNHVFYESRIVPIVRDGRVAAALVVLSDVTERRRAERTQMATFRISASAHTATSLQALYEAIHRIVGELMPARNFYIALYDRAADLISFPYFVDEFDPPFPPKKPGRGVTEYVLRTGKSLLLTPELAEELTRQGEVELIGAPSIDWLGVPLQTRGETIGAVVVQSYAEEVRYGPLERRILEFVSAQIAMAIEHVRTEEALRRSEEQYRELVDSARDLIFALSVDGTITALNPAFEKAVGWPRSEWVGRSFVDLMEADDVEKARALFAGALRGDPLADAVLRFRSREGAHVIAEVHASPRHRDGRVTGVHGIVRNITDRVRLEEQLRQAQKMEAVGRLAGGVAHDFNNLLTAIAGYSDLLLLDLAESDPRRSDVEEIKKQTERAAALTRQLLAFSRRQVVQPRVLDLNAVVRGAEKLLRRLIGEDIHLVTRLDPDLGAVRADAGQLEQVVMNLAVNARDAMRGGGTLAVETANVTITASRRLPEQAPMPPGRYVELRVSDTGVGIDEGTRRHLFEPFFTTRDTGKGTGLGLATVYGIVKQSGGFVWVDSAVGEGSTFTVDLPFVDEPVQAAEAAPAGPADVRGTETVLLVEDESAVRAIARETLRARGFKVLEAQNGEEALRVAEGTPGAIDLLLTDVVMPGISGRTLADRLKAQRRGLRVLYMSGYTADALGHHGVLDAGISYLQKPFASDQLARKVREVLDQPR